MNCSEVVFRITTATYSSVVAHLSECANRFYPPLYTYVNIEEYARKILERAVMFEAWDANTLVGLVAVYFNDPTLKIGYITNVSVLEKYQNHEIASRLIQQAIEFGRNSHFVELKLEVAVYNTPAYRFYRKNGFAVSEKQDDKLVMCYTI